MHAATLVFVASLLALQEPASERAAPTPNLDLGSGHSAPSARDDSIPLPVPPMFLPGAAGDRQVQPASGEPYFLGFASGSYYPPQDERIDALLASRLQSSYADGRPSGETYAFAMFSQRITPERVAELGDLGARVLGFAPHYALRIAFAPELVDQIAALPYVRWIGLPRDEQKVHPYTEQRVAELDDGEELEVYVAVFDSDLGPASVRVAVGRAESASPGGVSEPAPAGAPAPMKWISNGWQQRALEQLGLVIDEYIESTHTFRGRVLPAALEQIAQRDFVSFVQPVFVAFPAHDESMPMIGADLTRTQWGGNATNSVVVGIADTGYDSAHDGLNDPWLYPWGYGAAFPPTQDPNGHGSHVAGTLLGSGDVDPSWKGVAPLLGRTPSNRVFIARIFGPAGMVPSTAQVVNDFNFVYTDGSGNVTQRPHVINHSWGACTALCTGPGPFSTFWGSEQEAIDVDNAIYTNRQLHVFCAGNEGWNPAAGSGTIRLQGTAKNALTVGSVNDYRTAAGDPGFVSSFSSRGPCRDGRWKPNVCAPGDDIWSVRAGSGNGYGSMAGTSMATPHVTGLVAQMCDAYPGLRYQPERIAALLMSTAITKSDAVLALASDQHLRDYGAGRVEAAKALTSNSDYASGTWAFDQGWFGYTYDDFTVPANAKRLVVCMFYTEPGVAQAGQTPALVNDLDLWLDDPSNGISAGGNTGDYFAHQSAVDNTEIRILENPTPGLWRWKVYPTSVPNVFNNTHVAVAFTVITGNTKPNGTLQLSATSTCVHPDQTVAITATASNPSYVASAVFLDSTEPGALLWSASTTLKDGAVTELLGNQHGGEDLLLGDINTGDSRSATWTATFPSEGVFPWQVDARSDNWVPKSKTINITVDGTGPGNVGNLVSSTHQPNVWSNDPNISYGWTPALDNISGLFGYGILTRNAPTMPPMAVNLANPATVTYAETLSSGTWFFNIRALDNCANWSGTYANTGPYLIDVDPPLGPQNLSSTTHTTGVQSCVEVVHVDWDAATDAHAGLAGYIGLWDTSPTTNPSTPANIGPLATSFTIDIGSSAQARWFHLRAIDVAGNRGTTQHFGPIYANANSVASYCTGKTNSLGCVPAVTSVAQPSLSSGNFEVRCHNVLNNKNGLLFWGYTPSSAPFQGGIKCVAAPTQRTPVQSSFGSPTGNNCTGSYSFSFSSSYLGHQNVAVGDTLYAQWWMRDPQSQSTTGLSNGLRFTVCE